MSKTINLDYAGPYKGLNVQSPPNLLDPSETPDTSGFFFRNNELRSFPSFNFVFGGPDPKNPSLGQMSFMDANGVNHTVAWTSAGLYQLDGRNLTLPPNQNPWQFIGGPPLFPGLPVSARAFANVLYYTNGGYNLLSWDGIGGQFSSPIQPTVVATITDPSTSDKETIGGQYLNMLDDHLLLANVLLLDTVTQQIVSFPQRVWWSANGLPTVWDPTVNTNAGFVDFLEVPDVITGLLSIGNVGYVFRTNGITTMSPTGQGIAPFQFNHLWGSARGVGNVYPFTISDYGSFGCFVSTEQVYQISTYSFNEIGGGARDAIMRDLAAASGNPVGTLIPNYAYGYIWLTYVLSIPLGSFTRHYFYSIEDKNWTVRDTANLLVTGKPGPVWR